MGERKQARMEHVVIVSGVRTPIGSYGGTLKDVPVYKLAARVMNEVAKGASLEPSHVDDVIMGQS